MPKEIPGDLGKPVGPWFKKLKPDLKAVADEVHRLVLSAAPTPRAEIKWGNPCYSKNTLVCASSWFQAKGKAFKVDPPHLAAQDAEIQLMHIFDEG